MSAENAYSITPSAEEAWRLVGHYLHHLSHGRPEEWRLRDHEASQCRQRLWSAPTENGQDVTVALWLRLSDTEVSCDDPGCAARGMYLSSDGSGRLPASGPLPDFARQEGMGYFEYKTHPHCDGWAADVDPQAVEWMATALALYGGYMRINWLDLGGADTMGMGHSLWEVSAHQAREISRWSAVAGPDGVHDEGPTNPSAVPVLPLPREVEAKLKAAAEGRR
ncbi:hypothetical protein ACFRR6_02165 [Streptomyces sp. NPDC056891]|uniref:hypothetical protein n=1 Tax=Streptomyces sp. NPDC056891 TaxID=3345961 RepID=UPI00369D2454